MKKIIVKEDSSILAKTIAIEIANYINQNKDCLICLAAGDTPLLVYKELITLQLNNYVNLSDAYYVSLDEWLDLGYQDVGSCIEVMTNNFYKPANISADHLMLFDGQTTDVKEHLKQVTDFINKHNGIDYTLLGIGMNGHVGFNEPFSKQADGCLLFPLDEVTKKVSSKYFDKDIDVKYGIGVSINELVKADKISLIATGSHKQNIIKRTINDTPSIEVPASIIFNQVQTILYLDKEAFPK